MRARVGAVSATMVVALLVVACGSGSPSGTTGGNDRTYTIGVLTDATGPAASVNGSSVQGVAAGVRLAARDGYTIKYVVATRGRIRRRYSRLLRSWSWRIMYSRWWQSRR